MIIRFKAFYKQHSYLIILYLIAVLSGIIVKPTGDFPLNDDWAYGKSINLYLAGHAYNPGEWPAMTLVAHLLWGFLFAKTFGFSFFVLRISTWVSVLMALWLLNRLVLIYSHDRRVAFVAGLTLLFNPVYYNLSHTFMTDVNFVTLLLLCWYLAELFFRKMQMRYLLLFFLVSLLMVMTRQVGFVVPVSMSLAVLFIREKNGNIL